MLVGRPGRADGRAGASIAYDYLIVATGAAHAYFGHPEWAARAPGLKTLDDALEMRRRVLLAFEAAERETDPDAQRRLLTFVIVGGGPTGVELAGALAEIARQSLRQDFRRIRPESARIVLLEGGPHVLAPFPERLRAGRARSRSTRLGVEVRTERRVVDRASTARRRDRRSARRTADRRADGALGGRRRRVADCASRSACRSIAPAASRRADARACPRIPKSSSSATLCAPAGRQAAARRRAGRDAAGRARRDATSCARSRGEPLEPFRYRTTASWRPSAAARRSPTSVRPEVSGFFAWLFWIFLHIFWLIGFRNRFAS